MDDIITLAYGSGGKKTSELIEGLLLPSFNNSALSRLSDGAIVNGSEKLVFSTDSFVVSPCFFPNGDIGKLSVCGTVNDISVCGGIPKYLSLSFIIEEGLETEKLKKIIQSIKKTAEKCNVSIVTGDTKVVERGKGDGIYINTAGIGFLYYDGYAKEKISEDDVIILTGTSGDHGVSVMLARENLILSDSVVSDCAPLDKLCRALYNFKEKVRIMRDPTRGGVATTLNEFSEGTDFTMEIDEELVPVKSSVRSACEILGIDPLYSANEGKILLIADKKYADEIISEIKKFPEGRDAKVIGKVTKRYKGKVLINTPIGGSRILPKLTGDQLPRIC